MESLIDVFSTGASCGNAPGQHVPREARTVDDDGFKVYVPPSTSEWAERRAEIEYLYLDQKKPLSEVTSVMESKYGFKAT